jgi:hypothetical protein
MPIQKPLQVNLGRGVVSYPACSPTYRELCSTVLSPRHLFRGFEIIIFIRNVSKKLAMNKVWHLQGALYIDGFEQGPSTWLFRADLYIATLWARDLTENVLRVTCC